METLPHKCGKLKIKPHMGEFKQACGQGSTAEKAFCLEQSPSAIYHVSRPSTNEKNETGIIMTVHLFW